MVGRSPGGSQAVGGAKRTGSMDGLLQVSKAPGEGTLILPNQAVCPKELLVALCTSCLYSTGRKRLSIDSSRQALLSLQVCFNDFLKEKRQLAVKQFSRDCPHTLLPPPEFLCLPLAPSQSSARQQPDREDFRRFVVGRSPGRALGGGSAARGARESGTLAGPAGTQAQGAQTAAYFQQQR